jgi:hypothetical protein
MRAAYFLTRDPSIFRAPLRERPDADGPEHHRFRRTRTSLRRAARLLTRKGARPAPAMPAPER